MSGNPSERRVVDLGRAKLILGNGIFEVADLAGQFDAIVTDPPYGINYDPSIRNAAWPAAIVGDDRPFDPCPLLAWSKPTTLFGANHYADRLPPSPRWFVWDKRPDMKPMLYADCEMAWCSLPGAARIIRYLWHGSARGPETGEHYHPTQKPVEVMRWIIESTTQAGDTVLDPYMGSGTTGVAALQCGRKFIGIEIVPRFFDTAEMRIRRELGQARLF